MSDDDYVPEDVDYEPQPEDPDTDAAEGPDDSGDDATDDETKEDGDVETAAVAEIDEQEEKAPRLKGLPAVADKQKPESFLAASMTSRKVFIVAKRDRRTSDVVQPAEAANLIAMRAAQIAEHGRAFVDTKGQHDPVSIAFLEFTSRLSPLLLRRQVGMLDGAAIIEEWEPNTMVHPQIPTPPGMAR